MTNQPRENLAVDTCTRCVPIFRMNQKKNLQDRTCEKKVGLESESNYTQRYSNHIRLVVGTLQAVEQSKGIKHVRELNERTS